jgi:GT2 family glycosyltransferase
MLGYLFCNTHSPYEIIIIDNNSSDNSEKLIKEFFKKMKPKDVSGLYIKNSENRGFSIANNQGAKLASGEYLCFLNNDTIPLEGWLEALVEGHKRHSASVSGARLIIPGSGLIQHAGVEFDNFQYPYHKYFGKPLEYEEVLNDKECSAVTGACMLVNKDEFLNELKGFDEKYWLGWEDIDLCNSYKKLGKKIWYIGGSILYHYESMSDGRYSKETDNWYLYSKKWVFKVNK